MYYGHIVSLTERFSGRRILCMLLLPDDLFLISRAQQQSAEQYIEDFLQEEDEDMRPHTAIGEMTVNRHDRSILLLSDIWSQSREGKKKLQLQQKASWQLTNGSWLFQSLLRFPWIKYHSKWCPCRCLLRSSVSVWVSVWVIWRITNRHSVKYAELRIGIL